MSYLLTDRPSRTAIHQYTLSRVLAWLDPICSMIDSGSTKGVGRAFKRLMESLLIQPYTDYQAVEFRLYVNHEHFKGYETFDWFTRLLNKHPELNYADNFERAAIEMMHMRFQGAHLWMRTTPGLDQFTGMLMMRFQQVVAQTPKGNIHLKLPILSLVMPPNWESWNAKKKVDFCWLVKRIAEGLEAEMTLGAMSLFATQGEHERLTGSSALITAMADGAVPLDTVLYFDFENGHEVLKKAPFKTRPEMVFIQD